MNIVLIEPLGINNEILKKFKDKLHKLGHSFTNYDNKPQTEQELINRIKDQDIIMLANTPISKEVLITNKNIKYIAVAFTGLDHIPLDYCKENNILVTNCSGYSTISTSEQAIGMTLALFRKIHLNHYATLESKDNSFLGAGEEIYGKTVGIIGLGKIGLRTAKLFEAFGGNVIYYSRTKKDVNYPYYELDDLLKNSDIISLHVPYNKNTHHLLNKEKLDLIKENAVLINTARGRIIDNEYLAKLLNEERIKGAAIDVFDYEPPLKNDYPLINAKNILLTPHTAFLTKEALIRRAEIEFNNVLNYLNN